MKKRHIMYTNIKRYVSFILILNTLLILGGCGERIPIVPEPTRTLSKLANSETTSSVSASGNTETSAGQVSNTKSPDPIQSEFVNVNNFAFKLTKEMYQKGNNTVLSPASIFLLLGMLSNGTNGTTQTEILNVLNIDNNNLEQLNKQCLNLRLSYLDNEISKVGISNSIWIKDSFKNSVKQNFLNINKQYYDAYITDLDFSKSTAADTMNNWVAKNTNDLVKDLISPPIDNTTVMFLINTIYYKGDWMEKFKAKDTKKADFKAPSGIISADMMRGDFTHTENIDNDLVSGVILPYNDGKTSMVLLLPKDDINSLLNKIDGNKFNEWYGTMKSSSDNCTVFLPKFSVRQKTKLNDTFKQIGIKRIFDSIADFTNISSEELWVSEILHETYIKIDEEGTEAAGATSAAGVNGTVEYTKTFIFDKPFISAIVDNKTGTILFMTIIENPRG